MKKYFVVFTMTLLVPFLSKAQDLADALRYSNFQVQGTARAAGMGNAFGALGGDFTSISINPAGLGVYRSGELTFTPSFDQTKVEANYLGSTMDDSKYNFGFNNISYVTTINTRNRSEAGLISVNIGLGYNRLKSFNSTSLAGGSNANSSFLDYVASYANVEAFKPGNSSNTLESDYYEQLAWDTDLLLKDDDGVYWHDIEGADYGQSQEKSISRHGSIDEYSLSIGLNFNHKFYAGASVGINDIYYKESSQLEEWDANNNIPYFNNMTFNQYYRTTGTGYNVKLGVIFKPTNEIRLGASLHTPTFYNLHYTFDTEMNSSLTYDDGSQSFNAYPDRILEYDYDLETPLQATVSGAFVIAKKGLLSVDYEYVDYGSTRFRRGGDGENFTTENQDIADVYRSVGNLRVGGEYRLTNTVSLRAGYEYYPSAYKSEAFGVAQPNSDADMNIYSAGLGYRRGNFFIDLAYRYSDVTNYDSLYPGPITDNYAQPEMAAFKTTKNKFLFTFGFRF